MPARPTFPIGTSDFRQLRERGALYVDKTALISQVLADSALVLLFPRPRRFGKTTNITTLRHFLEKTPEDLSALFADLAVWRDEKARPHFQRYPVIFVTFKDIKEKSFQTCFAKTTKLLSEVYGQHRYLLESGRLTPEEATAFREILERKADQAQCEASFKDLSRYLYEHHGRPVVVLIDEYDTPLHAAFLHGYFDEAIGLYRGLLSGVLKDNEFLFKGVLTGILRIAKESIFSDLNNIIVYSLIEPRFAPYFGFTEPEVEDLARRAGFTGSLAELRDWYNGYRFGDTVIYNPWSVLSALDRGACATYWVNTSSNDLIRELLLRATSDQHIELEAILQGGSIRKKISENTVLRDIYRNFGALWSFLLFSGYLRASGVRQEEDASITAELSIPNRELRTVFSDLFSGWLEEGLGGKVEELARAILAGDAAGCERHLSRLLVDSVSVMDTAKNSRMPPEQLYHVFVLGLLLYLQPRFHVESNRESGYGRSDVLITPRQPGQPGVVLELKVRGKGQTLAKVLAEGLRQLEERDYAAALRARGAAPIRELAVAFDGKRVLVKARASA